MPESRTIVITGAGTGIGAARGCMRPKVPIWFWSVVDASLWSRLLGKPAA
jgi:hypothetical protein